MIANFLLIALLIASGFIIYLLYNIRFTQQEKEKLDFSRFDLLRNLLNSLNDKTSSVALLPFGHEVNEFKNEFEMNFEFHRKAMNYYNAHALSELREFATKASSTDKDFIPSDELKDKLMDVSKYLFRAEELNNWEESAGDVFVNMLAGKITNEEAKEKIGYPPMLPILLRENNKSQIEKIYNELASSYWASGKWEEHLKDLEAIAQK